MLSAMYPPPSFLTKVTIDQYAQTFQFYNDRLSWQPERLAIINGEIAILFHRSNFQSGTTIHNRHKSYLDREAVKQNIQSHMLDGVRKGKSWR